MKKSLPYLIGGLLVLLIAVSGNILGKTLRPFLNFDYSDEYGEDYVIAAPAESAEEWQGRFETAQKSYDQSLEHLYAELPPQAEWPAVIETLKTYEGESSYGENDKVHRQMMGYLLEEDYEAASELYLKLASEKKLSSYKYEETVGVLRQMMVPQKVIDKNLKLKAKKKDNDSAKKEKGWKRELKSGGIEKAIRTLMAKNDGDDWDTAYELTVLYEKEDLKVEVLAGFEEWAVEDISESSYISYDIKKYLKALVEEGDYERLHSFTSEQIEVYKEERDKVAEKLIPFHYIAISKLEDGAEYLEELKKLPEYEIDSEEGWIDFLQEVSTPNADLALETIKHYRENGKEEEALALLKRLLLFNGGKDSYYREFLQHYPEQALSYFDQLLQWDPYEERPHIWKGHYYLEAGELDKAEAEINKAIALDPSDGEQGKFTRMEAYHVFSLIFRARGNDEKADFFAEVTAAIRAGEVADDYISMGLYDEAIKRYEAALGHFEDAYCLQSRLAKAYLEKGMMIPAQVHFEKAFELMPVSFGPVESHCFGCEGIFKSELSQEVAERIFKSVIESSPDNPRTYYLIAKLYESQDKPETAIPYYVQAFKLDKNYYNCAKRLYSLMLQDPELKKEYPELHPQIMDCYPYPDLADLFEGRVDLKDAWEDAQAIVTTRPVPIEVPEITTPFEPNGEGDDLSEWERASYYPIDGWQVDELLRSNDFLGNLYFH